MILCTLAFLKKTLKRLQPPPPPPPTGFIGIREEGRGSRVKGVPITLPLVARSHHRQWESLQEAVGLGPEEISVSGFPPVVKPNSVS